MKKEYKLPIAEELVINFDEVIMSSGYKINDSLEMGDNVDEIL